MSEKRFTLKLCSDGTYYLYENNELIIPYIDFDKFNKESAERIIDLLNPLFDEHKQLLQSFENYKKSHNALEQRLNALSDENEQLKKTNEKLQRELDKTREDLNYFVNLKVGAMRGSDCGHGRFYVTSMQKKGD